MWLRLRVQSYETLIRDGNRYIRIRMEPKIRENWFRYGIQLFVGYVLELVSIISNSGIKLFSYYLF